MKAIKSEGTTFVYVPKSLQTEGLELARKASPSFETNRASKILESPDIRLVLFRSLLPPHRETPYYLVWDENLNLMDLDERVSTKSHSDEDFTNSIRTHFQVTHCPSCKSNFDTLVVDPGDPYPNSPDLLQQKVSRFKIRLCPNCSFSLRQLVAKFL